MRLPGILFFIGLIGIYIGERLVGEGTFRTVFDVIGLLLVFGSLGLRFSLLTKADESRARAERSAIIWSGVSVLGLVLYLTLNHTVQRVGAASAITLVIVGQLFAGLAIDYFGAFGIPVRALDPSRLVAVVLLLAGAVLMVR